MRHVVSFPYQLPERIVPALVSPNTRFPNALIGRRRRMLGSVFLSAGLESHEGDVVVRERAARVLTEDFTDDLFEADQVFAGGLLENR